MGQERRGLSAPVGAGNTCTASREPSELVSEVLPFLIDLLCVPFLVVRRSMLSSGSMKITHERFPVDRTF